MNLLMNSKIVLMVTYQDICYNLVSCETMMRKPVFTVSGTNQAIQSMKKARGLKLRNKEQEGLYYSYSQNKGADQLCSYCTADLHPCFRICKNWFSHKEAEIAQ